MENEGGREDIKVGQLVEELVAAWPTPVPHAHVRAARVATARMATGALSNRNEPRQRQCRNVIDTKAEELLTARGSESTGYEILKSGHILKVVSGVQLKDE